MLSTAIGEVRMNLWMANSTGVGDAVEYTAASLQRGKAPPNECPGYETKQFDSDARVMLELWGMLSTPSLPLLQGPL